MKFIFTLPVSKDKIVILKEGQCILCFKCISVLSKSIDLITNCLLPFHYYIGLVSTFPLQLISYIL